MCHLPGNREEKKQSMLYVISYDISQDKIRTKIAKELENYGVRIQYSVFECELDQKRFQQLYHKLLMQMKEIEDGSIRIYRICTTCRNKIITIGQPLQQLTKLMQDTIVI